MISFFCKKCNMSSETSECCRCGGRTHMTSRIYWCKHCNIPTIKYKNDPSKEFCPLCGGVTSYMAADIRPVFPEERLMLEILLEKPLAFINNSVWASNNRYYIDGKSTVITSKYYKKFSVHHIKNMLDEYKEKNSYKSFDKYISLFVKNFSSTNVDKLWQNYWL